MAINRVALYVELGLSPSIFGKKARSCLVIRPVGFFSDIKKPYILMYGCLFFWVTKIYT